MNSMKKHVFIILCLVLSLLTLPALAINHYQIDTEALKALEKSDTFDLRITRKVITDGANSADIRNQDILSFELSSSSDANITSIVITCAAHDENGAAQQLMNGGLSAIRMGTEARRLTDISFTTKEASPGAVFTLSQPCDHSQFTGVRAIVREYTTDSGIVVVNPLFEAWQEEALGRPTHILD